MEKIRSKVNKTKTELKRECEMDIKFTSQFIDKMTEVCLKQVSACWNSTFGILGLLIPELERDIPDMPKVRSSLKKSFFLSFCYVGRRALVSVKTTRVGRFVAPPWFWVLLHSAIVPSGGTPSTGPSPAHFAVSQWNPDLERFKKRQVLQRQTAVPQFVPCWCAGTAKLWHSCRYPQPLLFLPYPTWYQSQYNSLSVQHQHWKESVNTVRNSPRKTSTNFITIIERIA